MDVLKDRFMLFLILATALHALVLLGVSFGNTLKPSPRLADTLEVVLVKWRSENAPEEADFLAQASQQGGGEVTEKLRPSQPVSGELPTPELGHDAWQSTPAMPVPEPETREIVARETETAKVLEQTRIEQPDTPRPSAARLMRQSMEMASLQPELSRHIQWKSKLPRRKFISANTQEYEFASYMRAWVSKVERIGNMNYPSELRQKKLHGDLVLTVGIHQNGTVESIDIMRSSGIAQIDQAAVRIVKMCAPYSPLPNNISEQVDILHITRTWRFETNFGVE
ncbi:MAG: TonB family protein [Gammaproteobacteria bacterium]|nr:TonB family protein [Gammaproteobacteria bacterium]